MNNTEICESFTVEDIHKVREANCERKKNMTDAKAMKTVKKIALGKREVER